MTDTYVVNIGEKFLGSGEDGDIGLAPVLKEAKRFLSREEAEEAADRYADPGFEILKVDASAL